ncbi:hypothetical protein [Dasania marina]|uniref:hypothetical protein n=1 Tax=Dasania marina TaxID=471499 RepID=UPI00035F2AA2|nr:hypothetical protein [Dasania marina]
MQNIGNPQQTLLVELESIIDILDDAEPVNNTLLGLKAHNASAADIPMLEDVVIDQQSSLSENVGAIDNIAASTPSLFDLDRIFSDPNDNAAETRLDNDLSDLTPPINQHNEDEQTDLFPLLEDILPTATAAAIPKPNFNPNNPRNSNYHSNIPLIVQELVDEMIPELEARLRTQLSQLAPEMIRELAEKHLNK